MRFLLLLTFLMTACQAMKKTGTPDDEFNKALKESEANRSEKLDFLVDEKLPNEEYVVVDSAAMAKRFVEIRPERFAPFRIQIFAGSPENAFKTVTSFSSEDSLKPVYVIHDSTDDLWKVWIGDCVNRKQADSLKSHLIGRGYEGAWVYESKGPVKSNAKLWWLQLGSFQSRAAAEKTMERVRVDESRRIEIREVKGVFKLWVGGFSDRGPADQLKKEFSDFSGAFVVQEP